MKTNKNKHTPGPWNYKKNLHHDRFDFNSSARESWIGSINIERFHSDVPIDESIANASLIAAAPEMLEALENNLRLLETIQRETGYVTLVTQQHLKAVIKKARGE